MSQIEPNNTIGLASCHTEIPTQPHNEGLLSRNSSLIDLAMIPTLDNDVRLPTNESSTEINFENFPVIDPKSYDSFKTNALFRTIG